MRIDSKSVLWLFALYLPIQSAQSYVDDPIDTSMINATIDYSYTDFDNDRLLKNTGFLGASLGLQFSKSFSTSLYYSRALIKDDSGKKSSFENFYIEGIFYSSITENLRPYLTSGLGEIQQEQGKISDETLIHFGLGLHWKLTPKLALRTDWRYFHSFDDDYQDQALRTTLVYRFGHGEK